ncbi:hypothetical protein D3C85_1616630 [compost metagenome]
MKSMKSALTIFGNVGDGVITPRYIARFAIRMLVIDSVLAVSEKLSQALRNGRRAERSIRYFGE